MDIKKIWNSTRLFKTNGLTFSERIVQNFLIIVFMFGSSILIVTLMFGFALALAGSFKSLPIPVQKMTDKELYKHFKLTKEEIQLIEDTVK